MRKMKKNKFLSLFLVTIFIYSCASFSKNYGKLRMVSKSQNKVTIQDLINNWEDYNIYFSDKYDDYDPRKALGIMFDPKNNDTKLVGDSWKRIKSQKDLVVATQWIYENTSFEPWLNEILGPDGRVYGYLYYSYGSPSFKVVDDNTMHAFGLDDPQDNGPGSLMFSN
jgi:hypothetical protein